MVEEMKEQKKRIVEKENDIERLVKGIPEWCAQQAASSAANVKAIQGGGAAPEPHSTSKGVRKRKNPELPAEGEGGGAYM
jgi:hypothetical protein